MSSPWALEPQKWYLIYRDNRRTGRNAGMNQEPSKVILPNEIIWVLKISQKLILAWLWWPPRPIFLKMPQLRQKFSSTNPPWCHAVQLPIASWCLLGLAQLNETTRADLDYVWLSFPAVSNLWWIQGLERGLESSLVRLSVCRKVNRHAEWVLMTGNARSGQGRSTGHLWTSVSNAVLSVTNSHGNGVNHDVMLVSLSSALPQGCGVWSRAFGKGWMFFLVLLHLPIVWFLYAS